MSPGMTENHLHVACAIIERNGSVLAAQRSKNMKMPLKWEFPGGKIKPGETPEDCLRREIAEELGVKIAIHRSLPTVTHAYPTFTITLYSFVCSIVTGKIKLHEHAAVTWLPRNKLFTLDWAKADLPVVEAYCRLLGK